MAEMVPHKNEIFRTCYHALLYALVIAAVAISGFTDNAQTEDGLEHYAEKPWIDLHPIFPWLEYIPMPLNTLVNLLYVVIGAYWIYKWYKFAQVHPHVLKQGDLYMGYVFAWMSILYGHVQLVRILTQHHRAAILDQWYTLPIFAWGACTCHHVQYGWSITRNLKYIRVSTMSYALALIHPFGFDVALVLHILFDLYIVIRFLYTVGHVPSGTKAAFWKTLFSCVGFIILKLLDHTLPKIHPVFQYVSGHFLSKICDSLQFYFAIEFFFHMYKHKADSLKTN